MNVLDPRRLVGADRRRLVSACAGLMLALSAASAAHAGITFTTAQDHVGGKVFDPGVAPGEHMVLDFNSTTTPADVTRVDGAAGTFGFATGGISGLAARPSGDTSQYFYVAKGGDEEFFFDRKVESASVYWGSVDSYNYVDVLGGTAAAPVVLETITGSEVAKLPSGRRHFGQSMRVYIQDTDPDQIIGLAFRSGGNSFEFDDIAVSAVPEPGAWSMMILGLAGLGAALRARRERVATSLA